jgi:uncharacterized protein
MSDCQNCQTCQQCVTCQNYANGNQQFPKMMNNQQMNGHNCTGNCGQNQNKPMRINEITLWNTRRCNLRCDYCFVYKLHENQTSDDMSDEVINAFPNFLSKYCNQNPKLWFFGGEPLVNFNGVKKVYDVCKNTVGYGMTSNLTLMDEDTAKWLGKRKFSVLASIDGIAEAHNKHRKDINGIGTFNRAMEGLFNVRKYINRQPQIRCTVAPDTVEYAFDTVNYFLNYDFFDLALEPVYEVEWKPEDLKAYSKQLKMIADLALTMPEPLQIKPFMDLKALFNPQPWNMRCGLAQSGVGMDTDGLIYPCHRFVASHNKDLSIGDVFNGINEAKLAKYRMSYTKPVSEYGAEHCEECMFKNACIGGCLSCNLDVCGNVSTMPKSCCDIINMYIETFIPKYLSLVTMPNGMRKQSFH